jgi:hypothetical protein
MTATRVTALPLTAAALAADPRLLNGAWRAPDGLDLHDTLTNTHGRATDDRVWRAAVDIIEATYGTPGHAQLPAVRPIHHTDLVLLHGDTLHAVIERDFDPSWWMPIPTRPGRLATVCGLDIDDASRLATAGTLPGQPCPDCYSGLAPGKEN